MKRRIKINESKGWKSKLIEFKYEDHDTHYYCEESDWRRYEIIFDLVSQGVDEKLLDELYQLGYEAGNLRGYEEGVFNS